MKYQGTYIPLPVKLNAKFNSNVVLYYGNNFVPLGFTGCHVPTVMSHKH